MTAENKTLAERIAESNEQARKEGHGISPERWQEYLKSRGVFSATPTSNMIPRPQSDQQKESNS